jgi:MtfA peptidase
VNGLYLALVVCGVCAWVWWSPWLAARRRARAATSEFPVEWQALLEAELPLYLHLPAPLRERLNRRMLQFLAGRRFIGCDGLVVTPEMPVLIAAQAAVLALGPEPDPWPELQTILIYPGAFLSPHVITHEDGVVEEELRELEGESWSGDRVVLAWEEVEFGASDPHDGINVVVHEFAHQLDLLNEGTGGLPRLPQDMAIETWTRA